MKGLGHHYGIDLSMRVVLAVQKHVKPHWIVSDYAEFIVDRFGVSKATSFRLARRALDALCVSPAEGFRRSAQMRKSLHPIESHGVGMLMP